MSADETGGAGMSGSDGLTREQLEDALRGLGLATGDTVLVHSSYKSLGPVSGGPKTVIDALLGVLGPDGTLIVPTFNFGFCEGERFDARNTPSRMGVLSELVRTDPRSRRVEHPIYSFAAIGARAEQAAAISDPSSYGAESLFGRLREWDGKIMIAGLSYNDSFTFLHHVEEIEGVGYRYHKNFTGMVTDMDGHTRERTVSMYVRDVERGVVTSGNAMGELLANQGHIHSARIGDATVRLMRARPVFFATRRALRSEPHLLYTIDRSVAG
jgi:aminoglycoside 3-N-acetyltransferase